MVRRRQQNSLTNKRSSGSIRIISGLWRGRKLPVHDAEGLRPTTDRVKETLFNWLATDIPHSRCLDLFSGSGGLGFEAASRQADEVVMLELNKSAHQQLTSNISALKTDKVKALHTDALSYLNQQATPFDIVFIDPPFRKGLLDEVIIQLENNNWLSEDAMVYIETERELVMPELPPNWSLYREKHAGQVSFRLYQRSK
ncbi:16S rRNA (guanine(966)-N(2))-methyltransferase RsmD [Vibrio sp. SCSIO 43137]|uniref:16S rRNA (guanine(966)-N(2))-methyltransferase RsmD n=1 Tax=Vibrio sp. SCSIO 43137 TaxID=3021011 RepID=UPI0023076E67|nr:16S rRNA (guanine(966)-N(2))-methyltransferase RsmD [Vibrio sp. SCSIO 43137]WCE29623.1 16S rRNA (guanine(966)-N(2))-methyltransferase RsmD [Vibrio sp. SCSIO 43137]